MIAPFPQPLLLPGPHAAAGQRREGSQIRSQSQEADQTLSRPFSEGEFFPCEHKKDQRVKRRLVQSDPVYAGMIESLDESAGRILDYLDEHGLADDTLIFFTSDNGGLAHVGRIAYLQCAAGRRQGMDV